jgi:hypothetical protein
MVIRKHGGGNSSPYGEQEYRKSLEQDIPSTVTPPMTYLLQLGPISYFPPLPNNGIILWIHWGINPVIRSQSSWSNYLCREDAFLPPREVLF